MMCWLRSGRRQGGICRSACTPVISKFTGHLGTPLAVHRLGVWPENLWDVVRHKGALHGGQRFVDLGYGFNGADLVGPQDGIEPMRRIVRWIVSEKPGPDKVPLWGERAGEVKMLA